MTARFHPRSSFAWYAPRPAAIRALRSQDRHGHHSANVERGRHRLFRRPVFDQRNNRYRVVAIGADLPQGVALDTASSHFLNIVNNAKIPASVHLAESSDTKIQKEMQQSFGNAMLPGLLLGR